MNQWISENKEWLFSGIGVSLLAGCAGVFRMIFRASNTESAGSPLITINNNSAVPPVIQSCPPNMADDHDVNSLKGLTHILFIDDQKFKVVDILKRSGWIYAKRTSDVGSIDDPLIQQANILFIDVHGVGRRLNFRDEGLGLAGAIKDKYPEKKVVIYSAETQGERFHDSLRKADDFLPKNADPYVFQQLTERLAQEIESER